MVGIKSSFLADERSHVVRLSDRTLGWSTDHMDVEPHLLRSSLCSDAVRAGASVVDREPGSAREERVGLRCVGDPDGWLRLLGTGRNLRRVGDLAEEEHLSGWGVLDPEQEGMVGGEGGGLGS